MLLYLSPFFCYLEPAMSAHFPYTRTASEKPGSLCFETPRLTLREMQPDDAADMFRLNEDPDVVRYTGDTAFASLEEAQSLVQGYTQYRQYQRGRLLLHEKATGEFVGWCGLKYLAEEDETDLGYRLLRSDWGKGYATEAGQVCLQYGFEVLQLPRIIARALPANPASLRVMQKLGMVPEKEMWHLGQLWQQYVLLRESWRPAQVR